MTIGDHSLKFLSQETIKTSKLQQMMVDVSVTRSVSKRGTSNKIKGYPVGEG